MTIVGALVARIQNEPVLVTTFIGAVLELLIAFNVRVDDSQKAAILAVVAAVLALFARGRVTPT